MHALARLFGDHAHRHVPACPLLSAVGSGDGRLVPSVSHEGDPFETTPGLHAPFLSSHGRTEPERALSPFPQWVG